MKSVVVFCGSSGRCADSYLLSAHALGRAIAQRGWRLIYGGSDLGIMGAVSAAAMEYGAEVIGVIPQFIAEKVGQHHVSRVEIVGSMHQRKERMFALADYVIAMPGGMGTWEEYFEAMTWNQLHLHAKPCGLLNVDGFYDALISFMHHAVNEQFVQKQYLDGMVMAYHPETLLDKLEQTVVPDLSKWS